MLKGKTNYENLQSYIDCGSLLSISFKANPRQGRPFKRGKLHSVRPAPFLKLASLSDEADGTPDPERHREGEQSRFCSTGKSLGQGRGQAIYIGASVRACVSNTIVDIET